MTARPWAASYRDFLVITQAITQMQGGVVLSVGTQVMGPEVFLKGLAMARNVARQRGEAIDLFTTAVFDLTDLGPDIHHEAPRDQAAYYFRPYKTLLVRTVAEGGESFYVRGMYRQTFATLYQQILLTRKHQETSNGPTAAGLLRGRPLSSRMHLPPRA